MTPLVGLLLAPDPTWLALIRPLLGQVGLFVVTPETLWKPGRDGALRPNQFHREFLELRRWSGRPFAAHSVAMSPGTPDSPRRQRWLDAMRRDHALFGFTWWTDHHGVTEAAGRNHALPRPIPNDDPSATWACLAQMAGIVPQVGLESSWFAQASDPKSEGAFLRRATQGHGVLLDLHNVWAMGQNHGWSVDAYLDALGLDRVQEIHVSGGRTSGDGVRLDSHDTAVPEPVFALLEQVAPRCPALQAITLERFEGTVGPADVPALSGELARIARVAARCSTAALPATPRPTPRAPVSEPVLEAPTPLEAGLIAKLRFERLIQGDDDAAALFESDPAEFVRRFRAYDAQVPATAWFPSEEGRLWRAWTASDP